MTAPVCGMAVRPASRPPALPVPGWLRRALRALVSFGVLTGLWEVSAKLSHESAVFYPTPVSVWDAAVALWQDGVIPSYVEVSVERWLTGVGVGLACALPFVVAVSLSSVVASMFLPLLNFFHAIVELAWIPLFVLWFGYGTLTIDLSVGYVVFFLVAYNTLAGVRQVPQVTASALRTLGASRWQIARHVLLPGALPGIITGVRLGGGFGWRSLVGAEMIAGQSGLGYLIFASRQGEQTSQMVVGMVIIGVLWLAIDSCYLKPAENATLRRWGLAGSQE